MKTMLMIIALFSLAIFSPEVRPADQLSVKILHPESDAQVDHRYEISGKVSDPNADVLVVIHPMETSDFWVQPPMTVREDGSWKILVYFGEAGSKHAGKRFEVRAFANPVDKVSEGKTTQWPKAAARSNVIDVTRK